MDITTLRRANHTTFCDMVEYGAGWGGHTLCDVASYANYDRYHCHFMSFGISHDYSFDKAVREKTNCKGLAFDPSVQYPSTLTEGVKFFEVGANVLAGAGDDYMPGEAEMVMANVPELAAALGISALDILKMDCEGCEYALAGDIMSSNPRFLHNVSQFAVEIHLSPFWVADDDTALELGKLLHLLEEAGLELIEADLSDCGTWSHTEKPCNSLIEAAALPCGLNWSPNSPDLRCHNLLFSRRPNGMSMERLADRTE